MGQVSSIKKKKASVHDLAQNEASLQRKRKCRPKHQVIDQMVYKFVEWLRNHRIPVSGLILREYAKKIAKVCDTSNFTASPG